MPAQDAGPAASQRARCRVHRGGGTHHSGPSSLGAQQPCSNIAPPPTAAPADGDLPDQTPNIKRLERSSAAAAAAAAAAVAQAHPPLSCTGGPKPCGPTCPGAYNPGAPATCKGRQNSTPSIPPLPALAFTIASQGSACTHTPAARTQQLNPAAGVPPPRQTSPTGGHHCLPTGRARNHRTRLPRATAPHTTCRAHQPFTFTCAS